MSNETLTTLRILIPGVIVSVFFLPLVQNDGDASELAASLQSFQGLLYLVVVFPLGSLYYILDVRRFFNREARQIIDTNLKDKLLAPFSEDRTIGDNLEVLRRDRLLLDVFYNLIDNDESLKERAKVVRLNGLVWSSIVDVMVVSALAIYVYLCAFLFTDQTRYLIVACVCGVLYLLTHLVLSPLVVRKHLRLGGEQVEYIMVHHKKDLRLMLKNQVEASR